ncbi:hypothetical protein [Nocardia miyunensis]|nr:hypothetical protein [Nocardia miyunensis]
MPAYALPGTETGPQRARILGTTATILILLTLLTWRLSRTHHPPTKSTSP